MPRRPRPGVCWPASLGWAQDRPLGPLPEGAEGPAGVALQVPADLSQLDGAQGAFELLPGAPAAGALRRPVVEAEAPGGPAAPPGLFDAGVGEGDHQLFEKRRRGRLGSGPGRGRPLAQGPADGRHRRLQGAVGGDEEEILAHQAPGRGLTLAAEDHQQAVVRGRLPGLPGPPHLPLHPFGLAGRLGPQQEQPPGARHRLFQVLQPVPGPQLQQVLPHRHTPVLQGPAQGLGLPLVLRGVREEELAVHGCRANDSRRTEHPQVRMSRGGGANSPGDGPISLKIRRTPADFQGNRSRAGLRAAASWAASPPGSAPGRPRRPPGAGR